MLIPRRRMILDFDFRFWILMKEPSSIQNPKSKIQMSLAAVLSLLAASRRRATGAALAAGPRPDRPDGSRALLRSDAQGRRLAGAPCEKAAQELAQAESRAGQDAIYDRLLATLEDSHTFRLPAGRLPERNWGDRRAPHRPGRGRLRGEGRRCREAPRTRPACGSATASSRPTASPTASRACPSATSSSSSRGRRAARSR